MDKKVEECLGKIKEAIVSLISQANNELELIGIVTLLSSGFSSAYEAALDEGFEAMNDRLKEEK